MNRLWVTLGALGGMLGVGLGAFGAHLLKGKLSDYSMQVYETANRFQMWHALALVALGLASSKSRGAGWAFVVAIVFFSGSLYALAVTEIRWLGAITPIGGVSAMVGWALFARRAWRGNL